MYFTQAQLQTLLNQAVSLGIMFGFAFGAAVWAAWNLLNASYALATARIRQWRCAK